MGAAAAKAIEPLEQRLFLAVDPNNPPDFMLGIWQLKDVDHVTGADLFQKWKNLGVNTLFEMPECFRTATGTFANGAKDWTNAANAHDLWVVREPRRTAAYSDYHNEQPNFEDTCKDQFPAVTPAQLGSPGSASWAAPSTIWDPAADAAEHDNLLGFLQMDEPNLKYYPHRTPLQTTGSSGTPFYRQDMTDWLKEKFNHWNDTGIDVFLTFGGDHLDNGEFELPAFYESLADDLDNDGIRDRLLVADAVGHDWYPINNRGNANYPGYALQDPQTGTRSIGEAAIDWPLGQRTGQFRWSPGTQFNALREGTNRHTTVDWDGYDDPTPPAGVPAFASQRNFAVIETNWQNLARDPDGSGPLPTMTQGREPTPHEVRGQIWDSIINGANGIVYFTARSTGGTPPPASIENEIDIQNEIITRYEDVLVSTEREGPNPNIDSVKVESPLISIQGAWRKKDNVEYFVVQNMSHESFSNAKFKLVGTAPGQTVRLDPRGANTAVTVGSDGYITVPSMGQYETRIYSVGETTPPTDVIQAESFDGSNSSTSVTIVGTPPDQKVDDINNDDFLRFDAVNFDAASYTGFIANLAVDAGHAGGHIEVWLDARSTAGGGTKIGDLTIASTGSYSTFQDQSIDLTATPTGTRNLFLLFKGTVNRLAVLDYIRFTGGSSIDNRDARLPIQAEDLDGSNSSTSVTVNGNYVDDINNDDFLRFDGVNFGTGGLTKFHANLAVDAAHAGGRIEVWVDARSTTGGGTKIGELTIGSTGSYSTFQEQIANLTNTSITGVRNLFLLFKGSVNRLALLDWVKFS